MQNSKIFIIAEAGVNHNGCLDMAVELLEAGAEAGADAVKFQTFKSEKLVSRHAPKAEYQKSAGPEGENQLAMLRRLELSEADHKMLLGHAQGLGVMFLSTPFDPESIRLLYNLGLPLFKIGSGEVTNLPYLRTVGELNLPTILSTGMSTLDEVAAAVRALTGAGLEESRLTLLHCNTQYPTPDSDVNLRAMLTMKEAFPGLGGIGYSDHSLGLEACFAAAALGAQVLEKHFTLDRRLPGPDHQSSLEPAELAELVRGVRRIERMLGSGRKEPSPSERPNMTAARKSLVASRRISRGELFTPENLTVKRPGNGLSPMLWDKVMGTPARRDFEADELIEI
ncbi:MAG: N-acetylneuraminate synthase [Desulfovibrionaceae bacterium]|nr:N-acetylneuraminate synthase [Desulfovibrionaceae bacterium]